MTVTSSDASRRMRTSDDRQIVTVSTGYSYAAPAGQDFSIGDKIYVPSWHGPQPQLVEVEELGTDYADELDDCWSVLAEQIQSVIGRAPLTPAQIERLRTLLTVPTTDGGAS